MFQDYLNDEAATNQLLQRQSSFIIDMTENCWTTRPRDRRQDLRYNYLHWELIVVLPRRIPRDHLIFCVYHREHGRCRDFPEG